MLERYKEPHKKQLVPPPISGQILFLQVSTKTITARPEASRNSRRSDVRAKNLRGIKREQTHEQTVLLMPVTP